jgi:hypothetical protein
MLMRDEENEGKDVILVRFPSVDEVGKAKRGESADMQSFWGVNPRICRSNLATSFWIQLH